MNDSGKSREELLEDLEGFRKELSRLANCHIRFKKLFGQSRDGIVILDIRGKAVEANQKFADMLGCTLDEVLEMHVWDWDKNYTREELLGLASAVDDTEGHYIETTHTRKDGSETYVELSNSGTVVDGEKLIFCIVREVTDRKIKEAQLKESQEQLSTFIDNFQGIAYQVSLDEISLFKPKFFRGAIKQITGYSTDEFIQLKLWNDIVQVDDLERLSNVRRTFVTTPDYRSEIEYRIIRKDRRICWVRENAQIVQIGSKKLLHGTIFDITQQKSAEEAKVKLEEQVRHEQKLKSIGTLAGGVAHDFNNILEVIMGYTDLAIDKLREDDPVCKYMKVVRKASTRAKDIIQQLLMFSRKVEPRKIPLRIGPVIKETISFLRSTIPSTIAIYHDIAVEEDLVYADSTQIHQVVMNLCVNAVQAMENREGLIKIAAKTEFISKDSSQHFKDLVDGTYVKITVEDNGPGIAPEIMEQIFDPYFTTKETTKGSGMGLAVVHGIVESHGGQIVVENHPGRGTGFCFILPVVTKGEKKGRIPDIAEKITTGTETVLFIDDEEDIATVGKLILEGQGFRVQASSNVLDTLEKFKTNPFAYDIVITDMTMPYYTGDELFKELRKVRNDIPVILCTGHSDFINEDMAIGMGFSGYLNKPIGKHELCSAVRDVLDRCKSVAV